MSNNKDLGVSLNTCDPIRIIDNLERQSYLKPNFGGLLSVDNMRIKIEDFTNWLNSTFRISILHENIDKEIYLYLLLNLKKNLRSAIKEINKTTQNNKYKFNCNKCNVHLNIDNNRNFWECIQDHEHCEEILINGFDNNDVEMTNESTNRVITQPTIDNNRDNSNNENVKTISNSKPPGLNDFRFNFTVKYDPMIECNYYPERLMTLARNLDKSIEYSVQRSGVNCAVCLLCPCQITTRSTKNPKVSQFVLKSHISGQKHLKCAGNNQNLLSLRKYHEFWRIQDLQYQSHQVYFRPQFDTIKCHLCNENLLYDNVIGHVKNDQHKTNFIKWITSDEAKYSRLYLVEIQMSVYCKIDKVNGHTPETATSPPTTASKSTTAPTKKPTTPKNGNYDKKPNKITNLPSCNVVKSELIINNDGQICLPDRFKQHENLFKRTEDKIYCNLCKIDLNYDSRTVITHVRSQTHKNKQINNIKEKNYKYFCEICNADYINEDIFDNHFNQGLNRHHKIADNRRANLAVYECRTCLVVIYGDELSISRHRTTTSKANKKKDDVRLSYMLKRLFQSENLIAEEAERLTLEANQVLQWKQRMRHCCDDLEKALNQLFPNCKAYVFGSRISGTGNINSDLDIFMDIGGMYTGNIKQNPDEQEEIIVKVAKILKSCKDFKKVLPIPTARTPIIKLQHHFSELECDISFRHALGVENTQFLHYCIELQPITQPFILLLKKWSDECKFNEHITNYALALMAIFYLQLFGYLLPVKVVREFNPHPSKVIDGWETINYTVPVEKMREFVKPYESNVKQLLQDFFDYFSKFNYSNDVVCPLMGRTIPKMSFCERPEKYLPIEMKTYLRKIQTVNDAEHFRALSPFCIQDPFDLSHNLTKACPNSVVVKFKTYSKATFELLSNNGE